MELHRQISDATLGMRLLGNSKPVLPLLPTVVAALMVFTATVVVHLLVFKATMELGRGNGNRTS